jgi:hypothetical protein
MTAFNLEQRLLKIRRRIRRLLVVHGMSWIVAVGLGALLLAGLVDWFWHLDDPGTRLLLGVGILGLTGWIAWRELVGPLSHRFSDIELALRIERRFPGFRDGLASTVQFIGERENPRLGSLSLQRRVIEQTMQQVENVRIDDLFEVRPVRRIGLAAVVVAAIVATVVALHTTEAATAIERLLRPFSATAWPKKTQLRIVDSRWKPFDAERPKLQIAAGKRLDLYIENATGELPSDAMLEYQVGEGDVIAERPHRSQLTDLSGVERDLGLAGITVTGGPLWFRAVGGDDRDTPWIEAEVVTPPLVESLQVSVTPPEYAASPVAKLPVGVGHIRGLVGSRVDVEAVSNKPIRSASLNVAGRDSQSIALDEGRRRLRATFLIDAAKQSSYGFELIDADGFKNDGAAQYEIHATVDRDPEVYIEIPATDVNATREATIPLKISAKDDLALREMRLVFQVGESSNSEEVSVPLFEADTRPQQQVVEFSWEIARFALKEGTRIRFRAEATDYCDIGPPHVGRSLSRTVTIVSPQEKIAELDTRQSDLLRELEQVRQMQQQARDQVDELLLQLEKAGALKPGDLDVLKRVEIDQQQIAARLTDPVDGVGARVDDMLRELANNAMHDPSTDKRLHEIDDELRAIRDEHLPEVERTLIRARKSGKEVPPGGPAEPDQKQLPKASNDADSAPPRAGTEDQVDALANSRDHQAKIVDGLDAVVERLSRWQGERDVAGDVNALVADQKQLNRETSEMGQQTLTKLSGSLTPQEKADLAKLARRQRQFASRVAKLADKVSSNDKRGSAGSPDEADRLKDAHEFLGERATADRMREAGDQLEKNDLGQATAGQQRVLDDLLELQQLLEQRENSDLEELIKRYQQSKTQLDQLHEQQEHLQKKSQAAHRTGKQDEQRDQLSKLAKQQADVRSQTERVARLLKRLRADKPGDASQRAADRMSRAEEDLDAGAPDQAAAEQQDAVEDLEQAQRELAKVQREAEEQLALELLERMADKLASMIARQQRVIDETQRLDKARASRGNWSRAMLKSLGELERDQRQLQAETDGFVDSLKSAEVFALALRGAARQMEIAAARIAERKTDAETVAAETRARQRFVDLVESLKPEPGSRPAQEQAGESQGEQSSGQAAETVPQLAQLKLLKALQEDIVRRTEELDGMSRTGRLTPEQQAELSALAEEQGGLADMARSLMRAVTDTFETENGSQSKRKGE